MSLKVDIRYDKDKDQILVMPQGDIDIYTSNKFKERVMDSFEEYQADIYIDGSKLEYIDSTGLGVLISILKVIKDTEYKIILTNLKTNIRKLFDITELDKLFTIRGENDD